MTKLTRNSIILAKSETTYGTDPSPGGTDAVRVANLSVTPAELRTVDRAYLRSHLGASPQLVVGQSVALSFDVELAGSGEAARPPGYASLLKACGMNETVTSGNNANVAYKPVSSDFGSVTIHYHADGTRQVITGARGNVSLSMTPGAVPTLSFSLTGKYAKATDVADPTANYTKFKAPLPVNQANSTFTLDDLSAVVHEFSLDLGNQLTHSDLVGADEVMITGREATGSVVINLPTVASADFTDKARLGSTVALAFSLGSTAGARVKVTAPKVQLTAPAHGDADGVRTLSLGLRLVPSAGNDELVLATS